MQNALYAGEYSNAVVNMPIQGPGTSGIVDKDARYKDFPDFFAIPISVLIFVGFSNFFIS
jgi:hypothetical protein